MDDKKGGLLLGTCGTCSCGCMCLCYVYSDGCIPVCVCVCIQLLQDSMAMFNLDKSDRSKLHPHEQTDGTDHGADDELSTSYVCHRVSHADPVTSLLEILTGTIV